jgi:hypothetical protein
MALELVPMYGARFMMESEGGKMSHNFSACSSLLPTFPNAFAFFFAEEKQVPKVDDLWIPSSFSTPNHFIRFFILGIEHMLQVGDKILRVEASGSLSQLVS